jgi:hypothetical protein
MPTVAMPMNWGVRGVPTHFVVDAAGNVRFRVVGYATTWGLKARLWWAETFPASSDREPKSPPFRKGGRRRFPPALAWSVWGLGALLYLIGFYLRVAPAVITDQLMTEFAIGGAALGNLSAFYFYSYVAMQIPTGMIADRWGPRRLLTPGAGVAALGTALFAFAPSLFWANHGSAADRRLGGGGLRLDAEAGQPLVRAEAVCAGLGHGAADGRGRRRGGGRAAALSGRGLRLASGDGRFCGADGHPLRRHLAARARRSGRARLRQPLSGRARRAWLASRCCAA